MKVSDVALLKSGFSHADLQKLKNNIANYGGSLDSVIHDLANRFNASKWITIAAFTILILTLMLAPIDTSITLAATLAIVLPFIWYLTPAKLAYKSWRYRRLTTNYEPRQ
ncbi:hypothetical protein [Erwinia psidii]|uniref:Uncharacterized protein n=1 Tax=Erwinia psidii TaxID=69224 RepID=A0A3N6S9P5_9GAMM|nr:hypothetical protein [Erwinia psidii]MCX8956990.1 hypothetical protein [Erwinia psidii]MCX8965250.1 hypothetical protein [Erwinia psidii]RQM37950.1 hypothetical protein EB241_11730 [Erwinia psidii]